MQLEKISNEYYGDYFLLHIPQSWSHHTDQIRQWLEAQPTHSTFYPPNSVLDHLPGLLYFDDESAALAFILRWA